MMVYEREGVFTCIYVGGGVIGMLSGVRFWRCSFG